MARRVVDVTMLQGLVEGSANQEIQKGNRRSTDPKFPVFTTPVNENIVVYIPRTNMVAGENGEDMQTLNAYIHDYKVGTTFGSIRCISGLNGNPLFDALGYDGECPACKATADCWELYRRKMAVEAAKLGIDPQNDPTDVLKPVREKILQEMDLRGSEEYVTFPIVIIPTSGKMKPSDDALANLKPVFVTWKRKRYEESIISALDTLMTNPGHPGGMFWQWNFAYNTQGKQANARDSAKNAKYIPISDAQALQILAPYTQACEAVAKEFTLVKATEVLVANQFVYKEDYEVEVKKIMAKTRQLLELSDVTGGAPQLQAGATGGAVNPLANFGVAPAGAPAETPANSGMAGAPTNLGMAGNPVKFGA